MSKTKLMPSIVLGAICIIVAALLALVNTVTGPIIEEMNNAAANAALLEVLPDGKNFKEIEITDGYPEAVDKGWSADGGYVFQMTVTGYKPGLVIMCGIGADGKIVGVKHIVSNETYGFEGQLNSAYVGESLDSLELVIATGATPKSLTSKAYYNAVDAALKAYVVANGGTVDNRTPEQILNDNLNAALGTEGKTFVRWFESSSELGDAAIYLTDGGLVVAVGDAFVGYPDGATSPSGEHSAETLLAAEAAYAVYSSMTEINLGDYQGIGSAVKYAYKTADDGYLFRLERKGYKYASAPMVIELVIDKDGKIASCVTVSHSESGGFGAACGTPEYYEQYNGKDSSNYGDVPNIKATAEGVPDTVTGGATQTSNGYKDAVRQAFAAFDLIKAEGGTNQ